MLALDVELLTGRYVATEYNDRGRAEWPPHPARLFSALAAAHFEAQERSDEERSALEWLEAQGPPLLHASHAARREVVSVFVPVNDATVLRGEHNEIQKAEDALARAREMSNGASPTDKRSQKQIAKATKALEAALAKPLAPIKPKDRTAKSASEAAKLLPEARGRQPRTFPSVCPETPLVSFLWPEASPSDEVRAALDGLARRVVRLGHSSSLVAVRLTRLGRAVTHEPHAAGGLVLRVVTPGQTKRLADYFEQHSETQPRVMPAAHAAYRTVTEEGEPPVPTTTFDVSWTILARIGGPRLPIARGPDVAAAVRAALMSHAEQPVASVISGHDAKGAPASGPHLAVVPLPFVGRQHADGAILGVALVLPRTASAADRSALFAALARWEHAQSDAEPPVLELRLGRAGLLELVVENEMPRLSTLRAETWCGPARRWVSVSPVALDRNPGNLHSRDPAEAADAAEQAEASIRLACERIGLPSPSRVVVVPHAPVVGSSKARCFSPFPRDPSRTRRALTHVTIEFEVPVLGPLLVGAGRYLGLGLFRPASSYDDPHA